MKRCGFVGRNGRLLCRIWLMGWLLIGCARSAAVSQITCHTAYRSSNGRPIEQEEQLTFTTDGEQQQRYDHLVFNGRYFSGQALDNERGLRLWVTSADSADELIAQLYQFPDENSPQNQFSGGHGFTGLNYVYHPDTRAELQYWCTVDSP